MFAGESAQPAFLVLVADPYILRDESTLCRKKWLAVVHSDLRVVACRLQSQAELHLPKVFDKEGGLLTVEDADRKKWEVRYR